MGFFKILWIKNSACLLNPEVDDYDLLKLPSVINEEKYEVLQRAKKGEKRDYKS